jgi:hypothetical protein
MPTLPTTVLSEPLGDEEIAIGTLAYFRSRLKRRFYDLIIETFEKSGLTQVSLAKRLGLGPDRICRVLGGPGNLTLETVSDILFAMGGAEPSLAINYPLAPPMKVRRPSEQGAQVIQMPRRNPPPRTDVIPGLIEQLQEKRPAPVAA